MEILYVILIVVIFVVCALLYNQKKKNLELIKCIENINREKESLYTIDVVNQIVNNTRSEKDNEIETIKIDYEKRLSNLREQVTDLEKQLRNFGEIKTHKILLEIRKDLIRSGKINPEQMHILPNIFITYKNELTGELVTRQIDHLVLLKSGIFIIETKYWRGNIVHGITLKTGEVYSYILKTFYPNISSDEEKTIVFLDESDTNSINQSNTKEIKIVSYGEPAKQVRTTAMGLSKLLKNHGEKVFVEPILYFNHEKKQFKTFSKEQSPLVFINEKALRDFFIQQIEKNEKYSESQLAKIKKIIEEINYL
ncbi:nuclease-related domain-containing protein [Ureibacillus thermosphaericus]|uniref:nuclease-related domain-containing protein n=1 Tax=Ureibacillus thermosphaericus TaxID=51173 RepID=UPI0002EEE1AC|nr:nuclease-related domain-containing protein [Ureibacillus thermosphaericus]